MEPIPLNHATVSHFLSATPKKCEDKLNEMLLISKRQMQNWERSGQGEGGYDENGKEDEFFQSVSHELGSLDNRPHRALQTHANFFKYSNMYLLYFWDMIEKYQLRKSCLQMLDDKVAAKDGGGSVPSVFYHDFDDESFKSLSSKKSKSDTNEMSTIADALTKFTQRSIKIQNFEKDQKEKDRAHATNECLRNELHASKERISTEIDNLECDKRKYEWNLMVYNSKRQKPTEPDPTATAMHGFIDKMIESLNKKKVNSGNWILH